MVRYRRNFVAGGTFFFTATLVDRSSRALIDHIEALRVATRDTRRSHPFAIDAIVVLPDHLHVVMTLPEGDADYPNRWGLIKRRFTDALIKSGTPIARHQDGEFALWQRRFWEHTIRDESDLERHVDYVHFNPVRHGLCATRAVAAGLGRRFHPGSTQLRRTALVTPDFASLNPGYLLGRPGTTPSK